MSFPGNAVESKIVGLDGGEVIKTSPYNISSFDKFEDGLLIGRLCKLDGGSIDNLDGSATPFLAGVPVRRLNKALQDSTYSSVGTVPDGFADVATLGKVSVITTDAATPARGNPVYVINAVGNADNGKVTQDAGATGALLAEDLVFDKQTKSGVWIVTIKKYLV